MRERERAACRSRSKLRLARCQRVSRAQERDGRGKRERERERKKAFFEGSSYRSGVRNHQRCPGWIFWFGPLQANSSIAPTEVCMEEERARSSLIGGRVEVWDATGCADRWWDGCVCVWCYGFVCWCVLVYACWWGSCSWRSVSVVLLPMLLHSLSVCVWYGKGQSAFWLAAPRLRRLTGVFHVHVSPPRLPRCLWMTCPTFSGKLGHGHADAGPFHCLYLGPRFLRPMPRLGECEVNLLETRERRERERASESEKSPVSIQSNGGQEVHRISSIRHMSMNTREQLHPLPTQAEQGENGSTCVAGCTRTNQLSTHRHDST
jgi:hypothetical protein